MRRHLLRLFLGGILLLTGTAAFNTATPASAQPARAEKAAPAPDDPDAAAIAQALQDAIKQKDGQVLAFVVYQIGIDHIVYTPERDTAVVWLSMTDPADGQVIATEPGLAIAHRNGDGWQIILQADYAWADEFAKLPPELIPTEQIAQYDGAAKDANTINATYYGYKLPWGGGQSKQLEGSIGHFLDYHSCTEEACRYAYDFADGTMFPLLASRGGTVNLWNDSCTNGDENCSNYIVLKDASTSPTTYQLYLHMANNTIPSELKRVGAQVNQGQFIGNVDDTGYSTGHHLHFMVHTNQYSYWGNSVDIRFDEVDINGGVPRTQHEATTYSEYGTGYHTNDMFTSGNALAIGPTGGLSRPDAGSPVTVTGRILDISGAGTDDRGVVKMQVLARTVDSDWFAIGAAQTNNPFDVDIDLCASGLPDGPITFTLQLWDVEGNTTISTDYRTIIKKDVCRPACQPAPDQVALYTLENYSGSCQLFNPGSTVLESTFNNHIRSILVGNNAIATLYTGNSYNERRESWSGNDPNLSDDQLGNDTAGSLQVLPSSAPPGATQIVTPHNVEGQGLTSVDSVLFSWIGGDGAVDFSATLTGSGGFSRSMDWLKTPAWSVGSLPAGDYTLTVTGRNPAGQTSTSLDFSIGSASLPAATPISLATELDERFESANATWIASGLARRDNMSIGSRSTYTWGFNDGSDYSAGATHSGSLTSPPIVIPAEGAKMFFEYYHSLGDSQPVWDERWLQISVNNGDFVNFYQFQNDRMNAWLISPLFDLSAYAGQTIRLRWYFHVVDGMNNTSPGWFIDNLYAAANPPVTSCKDVPANDSPATATSIANGRSTKFYLCPSGDLDYYTFEAQAGDNLSTWIEAQSAGSSVDGVLYLLDSDGSSVLTYSDDPASGVLDPKLSFQFTHNGRYFLRFRDFKHPGYGGVVYYYYINFSLTGAAPQVTIINPTSTWMGLFPFQLSATVNDPGSSVSKVEFFRHSSDWSDPTWTLLGTDTNGSNGWSVGYTPSVQDNGAAFYVRATDNRSLSSGDTRSNLIIDSTPPTAEFSGLPPVSESTYIPFAWSVSDDISGLAWMELMAQVEGSGWQSWNPAITLNTLSAAYLAQPGQTIHFCINARDAAGNLASPAGTASTTVESTCTPDYFESMGDNQVENATVLEPGSWQAHNFCAAADEDWLRFTATENGDYMVLAMTQSGGAAATIEAYDSTGGLLGSASAAEFASSAALHLNVVQGESYFLRFSPINPNLLGSQVYYEVWIGPGFFHYLPAIQK